MLLLYIRSSTNVYTLVLAELHSGRRAEPHSHKESTEIGKPWTWVFMVIMASGMAQGRVRCTYVVHSRNRLTLTSLILGIQVMVNWQLSNTKCPLTSITWPSTRHGKIDVHLGDPGSGVYLIKVTCFFKVDRWKMVFYLIAGSSPIYFPCLWSVNSDI